MFQTQITTNFDANDLYNKAFIFFASVGGGLILILLIVILLYRRQVRQYNMIMESKREFKREQWQKSQDDLREDLTALRAVDVSTR